MCHNAGLVDVYLSWNIFFRNSELPDQDSAVIKKVQSKIGKVFGSDKKQSWVGCLLLSRLSKEVVTMVVFATLSEAKKIVFASLCNELCYAVEGFVLASLLNVLF